MTSRISLGLSLVCLLFGVGYLWMPDRGHAQPETPLPAQSNPIVMWSGTLNQVPLGWQLCDGSNGTSDLRDRFVQSIETGQPAGGTGGAHQMQLSSDNLPAHSHSFQTGEDGFRVHSFDDKAYWPYEIYWGGIFPGDACNESTENITRTTETAGDHVHTGETYNGGGSEPFDNRPAYYTVAFIMKVD